MPLVTHADLTLTTSERLGFVRLFDAMWLVLTCCRLHLWAHVSYVCVRSPSVVACWSSQTSLCGQQQRSWTAKPVGVQQSMNAAAAHTKTSLAHCDCVMEWYGTPLPLTWRQGVASAGLSQLRLNVAAIPLNVFRFARKVDCRSRWIESLHKAKQTWQKLMLQHCALAYS